MVADLDNEGAIKDKYIRGLELIESEEEGYYVYDGHGDVVQLVDESGAVRKDYRYDAFGVEEGRTKEDTNPFRYTGEYFDSNQKRFGHSKSGFSLKRKVLKRNRKDISKGKVLYPKYRKIFV